jgi:cysteine desulfurase
MAKSNKIYLDYASSVLPNPSSIHSLGLNIKKELEKARSQVAILLGARESEIIFTSGGTESNNLAIQGSVFGYKNMGLPHIITTNIEHSSVLETFKLLEQRKLAQITVVPVEENGIIDPKKIKKEIKSNTILVSVMYANNEIGTIQPIKEIAKEIRHWNKQNTKRKVLTWSGWGRDPGIRGPDKILPFRVLFHTDAVQAVNYLDLNVERLGVDMMSLSGSKVLGAGGVGVLYKRVGVPLVNIFGGGDQELGLRPGTENVVEILKFTSAFKKACEIKDIETKRLTKLRDYFLVKLSKVPFDTFDTEIIINGDLNTRLSNNINITIPKIPSDLLVIELSEKGIMASAKSACKSGDGKASYVIEAIRDLKNKDKNNEIDGSLRFSMGRDTNKKDIDYTIKSLTQILQKLKKWYN